MSEKLGGDNVINTADIDKKRWITLILQILVGSVTAYTYCLTVYIGPFAQNFGWDPAIIVLSFTAMMVAGIPGSMIGGYFKQKFNTKWVLKVGGLAFGIAVIISSFSVSAWMYVICYGILANVIMFCIFVAQMDNVAELFPDKTGMALGIVNGGIAIGSALIIPLAQKLTEVMDVMHSIALQGVAYGLLVFIAGFLIVEAPKGYAPQGWVEPEVEVLDESKEVQAIDSSWRKMIVNPAFIVLFAAIFFCTPLQAALSSNLSGLAQDALGVSAATGAWIYSMYSIMSGAGGFILGILSDKLFGPLRTFYYFSGLAAIAGVIFAVSGGQSYVLFVIVSCIFGLVAGGFLALMPNMIISLFGNKDFGVNYGILTGAGLLSSLVGTQMSIRCDINQMFYVGAVMMAVGLILGAFSIKLVNKAWNKKMA